MKIIGDSSRPRAYCQECKEVVYCKLHERNAGVRAINRLKKIHKQTDCKGEVEYMAGF